MEKGKQVMQRFVNIFRNHFEETTGVTQETRIFPKQGRRCEGWGTDGEVKEMLYWLHTFEYVWEEKEEDFDSEKEREDIKRAKVVLQEKFESSMENRVKKLSLKEAQSFFVILKSLDRSHEVFTRVILDKLKKM